MRHRSAIHFIRQFHFLDFFDPQVSFFTIFRHSEAKIRKNPKIKKFGKVNQQSCSDRSPEQVPRDDPSADPPSDGVPDQVVVVIRLEPRFQHGSRVRPVFGCAKNKSRLEVCHPRRQKTAQRSYEPGAPRGRGGRGGGSPR